MPWIVAVDPGSVSLGVCLSEPTGEPVRSWSIRVKGDLDDRLRSIAVEISLVFGEIQNSLVRPSIELTIEEGIYAGRNWSAGRLGDVTRTAAMMGEVRGVVMAEAFHRGWTVKRMAPASWKTLLSKTERSMKKDSAYVRYWAGRLGREFKTSDEVDSVHIARRVVSGRR
jgi:Holliday junction resolvasome RuvABC endonuclease subunit